MNQTYQPDQRTNQLVFFAIIIAHHDSQEATTGQPRSSRCAFRIRHALPCMAVHAALGKRLFPWFVEQCQRPTIYIITATLINNIIRKFRFIR